MASSLELQYLSGESEHHPLSRDTPVSIGSHFSNDVCIDEAGVEKVHCRVAWGKSGYEVTAGSSNGVEVNGNKVKKKVLESGDQISIGSVDIAVQISSSEQRAAGRKKEKPAPQSQEEYVVAQILDDDDDVVEAAVLSDDDDDDFEDIDLPPAKSKKSKPAKEKTAKQSSDFDGDDEPEEEKGETALDRMRAKMLEHSKRPGDRDALRSPFVIGLVAGALVLLLAAATFYFIIGRDTAQRKFDAALAEKEQGSYKQAIKGFETFLQEYPNHKLTDPAFLELGKSKVLQLISGATPPWEDGLKEVKTFIADQREKENFKEQRADIHKYAVTIATGSAKSAEKERNPDLLVISEEAQKLVVRYNPTEEEQVELVRQIDAAQLAADRAIHRQNDVNTAVASITESLDSSPPKTITALITYRKLLERHPDADREKNVRPLRPKILQTELAQIQTQNPDQAAESAERATSPVPSMTVAVHTLSQTDLKPGNRIVLALAKDAIYGVDTITTGPMWRRVIGHHTPFYPLEVRTQVESLLLYDTNHGELVLLNRANGELIWRQALEGRVQGPPVIHKGQIYQPTDASHLYKMSLETGKISSRLTFGQKLLAPPLFLAENESLLLAADEALVYSVSTTPMKCETVSFIGHKKGGVVAPLLRMNSVALMIENDQTDSARLRVLAFKTDSNEVEEVESARVTGSVRYKPLLRGKQLLVPSDPERVTAFTVSDAPDQQVLSEIATYQLQTPIKTKSFLTAASDGLFWMGTSGLRKFQVQTDRVVASNQLFGIGIYTQPLQSIGDTMYVARKVPYGDCVYFVQVNRDELEGPSRVILGGRILAYNESADSSSILLTESGYFFKLQPDELKQKFLSKPLGKIDLLPEKVEEQRRILGLPSSPLEAITLPDGSFVVWTSTPRPRMWMYNKFAELQQQVNLKDPIQGKPIPLAGGVVIALPGRLRLLKAGSSTLVEDFLAQGANGEPMNWKYLTPLDDEQLIALDTNGKFLRIQYRTSPQPHLAEASPFELGAPVDVPFGVGKGRIVVADDGKNLQTLDALTWEPLGKLALPAKAQKAVWTQEDVAFVELAGDQLQAYGLPQLKPLWANPMVLPTGGLAGSPMLVEQGLIVATQTGAVWLLNPVSGEKIREHHTHQSLIDGPTTILNQLVVPADDGTLYPLDALLSGSEAANE